MDIGKDSDTLVQLLTDVKTDILMACCPKEQVTELDERVKALELLGEEKGLPDELQTLVTQMQALPLQLQALQAHQATVDTYIFDMKRSQQHVVERLKQFGQLESEILTTQIEINKNFGANPEMAAKERLQN